VRSRGAREAAAPRPGVSFISTAAEDRARAVRAAPTLPRVPQLQRTDASRAPARRPAAAPGPHRQAAQGVDARARAARIEAARRQAAHRPPPVRGAGRPAQPAYLRAPDFGAQRRARAAQPPPRFQRPPDFRQMRPMPHAAPAQRSSAPPPRQAQPARSGAAPAHPRHESARRFDPRH
jgi:hypothetical protein